MAGNLARIEQALLDATSNTRLDVLSLFSQQAGQPQSYTYVCPTRMGWDLTLPLTSGVSFSQASCPKWQLQAVERVS